MNSTIFNDDGQLYLAAGGPQGMCQLYKLRFAVKQDGDQKLNGPRSRSPNGLVNGSHRERHNSDSLRRRRTSSASSNKENPIDEELADTRTHQPAAKANGNRPAANGELKEKSNGNGNIANGRAKSVLENADTLPSVTFDLSPVQCIQVDFTAAKNDEPFHRITRHCPLNQLMITGGQDGHVRLWRCPDFQKVCDIPAHTKDVDDIDIDPQGNMVTYTAGGVNFVLIDRSCRSLSVSRGTAMVTYGIFAADRNSASSCTRTRCRLRKMTLSRLSTYSADVGKQILKQHTHVPST